MSITSADDRITTYAPVVATTEFAADFPVFDDSDIKVHLDGEEVGGFTISASYADGISNDAKAVFASGITGDVQVIGSRQARRSNRFVNGAPLPIRDQNLALDTLEAEVQELYRDATRAVKVTYGQMGYTISPDLVDGDTLMKLGDKLVKGANALDISMAQFYAAQVAAIWNEALLFDPDNFYTKGQANAQFYSQAQVNTLIAPFWRNQRLSKIAAYTVTDADLARTITLGGSALYTVSFGAVGGYDPEFYCYIQNEDTLRGKRVDVDGLASFILWPGQTAKIYQTGSGVWVIDRPLRYKLGTVANDHIFYLDPVNGTVSGVGLVDGRPIGGGAGCFKTPTDAYNNIIKNIDCNNILPEVHVLSALSGETILAGFAGHPVGSTQVKFVGVGGTPIRWVATANNQVFIQCRDGGILTFENFDFDAVAFTGVIFFDSSQKGVIDYAKCWFGAALSGSHIRIQSGGSVNCIDIPGSSDYKVYGSMLYHVDMSGNATFVEGGVTFQLPNGLTFSDFIRVVGPGFCNLGFTAFSGTGSGAGSTGRRWSASLNGVFSGGGSTLPGTIAGATATGGQSA